MSKDRFEYRFAMETAEAAMAALSPVCQKIELAGSLRRDRPFVHDVDLVLWPKVEMVNTGQPTLFGGGPTMAYPTKLIDLMMENEWIAERPEKYPKKLVVGPCEEDGDIGMIPVELYLCEPDGSNFAALLQMRTGPAELNVFLSMRAQTLPPGYYYRAGYGIYRAEDHVRVDDGTEEGIFAALQLRYLDPWSRDNRANWRGA